jgi:hypothetical protein
MMKFRLEHPTEVDGVLYREVTVRAVKPKEFRRHFDANDPMWGTHLLATVTRIPEATLMAFNPDDLERMADFVARLSTGGR